MPAAARPFAALIVAAGEGLRAGQPVPKQFAPWRGKPVLRHSAEALRKAGADPLVVAIPAGAEDIARDVLAGIDGVLFVTGGATRQASVRAGLEALADAPPEAVLIHDAARPNVPEPVIKALLEALREHEGAVPALPLVDSIVAADAEIMRGPADRGALRRVQTPQAFRFAAILAAHRAWTGAAEAGDDAQVLHAAGGAVALLPGDERLAKLTFAADFAAPSAPAAPPVRLGTGYDVHRLAAGEELWLGGINIPHHRGLAGHSDADVALHALVDAILGALGDGDIGTHFPPSDARWRGAASGQFLTHAAELTRAAGYRIAHLDCTIICEEPRIGPHRAAMRQRIAELAGIDIGAVSVKGTTTEGLGFTGRGEGIAAQAAATLIRDAWGHA